MKKILFFTLALCFALSSGAMAKDMTGRIGLGFTTTQAPLGGIYWITDQIAVDAGFGMWAHDNGTDTNTNFTISGGVPYALVSGDRVNFYVRPGAIFKSIDLGDDTATEILLSGSLMFEVFVTDDFSVSASQGFGIDIMDPPEGDSTTDFGTLGNSWTNFGFFYYLPASK